MRGAVERRLSGGHAFDDATRFVLRAAVAEIARRAGRAAPWSERIDSGGADLPDLAADELGALYEPLLDREARRAPADDEVVLIGDDEQLALPRSRLDARAPADRAILGDDPVVRRTVPCGAPYLHPVPGRRKTAGAWYTGDPLAAPTVERVLGPGAGGRNDRTDLPRVVDAAMGGGAFLVAALRVLVRAGGRRAGEVVHRSLFGVDVDPLAVELARLALWLEADDESLDLGALEQNLRVADGLFDHALEDGSFDAVIGNPPWEIVKPNSREFFLAVDPFYRRLGKREALARRAELFAEDPTLEAAWEEHVRRHREFTARVRGSPRFARQGSGDTNTYKLFIERALGLLAPGGGLGLIVPSGIVTDLGGRALRRHLLEENRLEWLFMFENKRGIFDIHRSWKFGAIVARKGGTTERVRTAFLMRDPAAWASAKPPAIEYPRRLVERLSPRSFAFLEVQDAGELERIDRMFDDAVLIGELAPATFRYRREFDLTNHVRLFRTAEELAREGLAPDGVGRFADAGGAVRALPLMQGVMVQAWNPAAVAWVGGYGSRADWRDVPFDQRVVRARYHVRLEDVRERCPGALAPRLGFRDVQNATNERTLLAALVPGFPCGNTVPTLSTGDALEDLRLLPVLNSFVLDRVLRLKMSQNHVNWFYVRELPLPRRLFGELGDALVPSSARLACVGPWFDDVRARLAERFGAARVDALVDHEERRSLRVRLDAAVAWLYGMRREDLASLFADCGRSVEELAASGLRRALDPKGFWRVDRDRPPEQRLPARVQRAFVRLERATAASSDPCAALAAFLDGAPCAASSAPRGT